MQFKKKGFSYIELVAIMAVISVMLSVTLVSLFGHKYKREVEVSAREVAAAIREAQNNALAGRGVSDNCKNFRFGYSNTGTTQYYIEQLDSTGGTGADCSPFPLNFDLKNDVKFEGDEGFITFEIPWGSISAGSSVNVPIVLKKNNAYYTVCVNSAGSVTEKEGNVACL